MSVIGIDFGNESCYVAVAKAGGIETIANDYSLRATPSCVAFVGQNRILGVAAKNQQVTNMRNTIVGFKRLLGRTYNDQQVQDELKRLPYRVEAKKDGSVGVRVDYLGDESVFSPEQLTAMLFTKLKDTSSTALQTQINDCVIAVPFYFTNAERKALLDAAQIAGLNVLRLMNETTATALSYGFYKQDLPEDKPRNVIFVDCGHATLQVSAVAFEKSKLKMLACACDQVGGRDFDYIMADHFSKEFVTKYKIDPRNNMRAYVRLLAEVEKIKKQMSANTSKLPLNIECFMNDIDVSSGMQRGDMEDMCAHLFKRIEETMKRCLKDSKLTMDDIHSVEIVGGSSRMPGIKHLIEQIFGKTASTTLNQDEAVSRGAALQCAILSPAVRVRDFNTTDILNYSIKCVWDDEKEQKSLDIFPRHHQSPFSRLLTVYKREPFTVQLHYAEQIPFASSFIGQWHVKDVKPNANGDAQEVKLKVRINTNGIILISSANLVEKNGVDMEEPQSPQPEDSPQQPGTEPMEVLEGASDDDDLVNSPTKESKDKNSGRGEGGWTQKIASYFSSNDANEQDKKKKSAKTVELALEAATTHGYSLVEMEKYIEKEFEMIANDRREKERIDARNALEEFVYDMRGKLQEGGELSQYVDEKDRQQICSQLDDLENWIYEEGEGSTREVYAERLRDLHTKTNPIKSRHDEYVRNPQDFEDLGRSIQMANKAVASYRAGDVKYDHLTETEILNVSESAERAQKWLIDAQSKMSRVNKTADPPVKCVDIRHENQTLMTCVNSVLSRPKPKPASPPPAAEQKPSQKSDGNGNGDDSKTENPDSFKEDKMDVE